MLSLEVLERVRAVFFARESGFLSLNFCLAQKQINRERKQGLQAETRPGCTFPAKKWHSGDSHPQKVPVTERAVFGLWLGQISVQLVPEWPYKCGPNCRLWPKFNFFLWSGHAANSNECQECSFPLKLEFTCDKSSPLSCRGETVCLQQTLHWKAPERWVWSLSEPKQIIKWKVDASARRFSLVSDQPSSERFSVDLETVRNSSVFLWESNC